LVLAGVMVSALRGMVQFSKGGDWLSLKRISRANF
jgi:hypothetical protein